MIWFGGTFDPVHEGHIQSAERVRKAAGVARLNLLPCAQPAHRNQPQANFDQRVQMLQLALSDFPQLHVDESERTRPGPNYTVQSLRELTARLPAQEKIGWVLGQDSFNSLHTWREPEVIAQMTAWIVLLRDSATAFTTSTDSVYWQERWQKRQALSPERWQNSNAGEVFYVDDSALPISSTSIRLALGRGEQRPVGLAPAVADYIRQQGLYRP